MAFRSDLEAVVLAALSEGPKHGYAIVKAIRLTSDEVLKLGEAQLYPVLHRLEGEGAVSGIWEAVEGKPSRKVYSLTKAGVKQLESKREEWRKFQGAVQRVMGGAV